MPLASNGRKWKCEVRRLAFKMQGGVLACSRTLPWLVSPGGPPANKPRTPYPRPLATDAPPSLLVVGGPPKSTTMRDPFPLAEIPLAAADESTESESSAASGDLSMRALVPHGSAMATGGAESGEPLRSEDDTALMRSLISLMPHERADSQVQQ